jgi:hypothetical protein
MCAALKSPAGSWASMHRALISQARGAGDRCWGSRARAHAPAGVARATQVPTRTAVEADFGRRRLRRPTYGFAQVRWCGTPSCLRVHDERCGAPQAAPLGEVKLRPVRRPEGADGQLKQPPSDKTQRAMKEAYGPLDGWVPARWRLIPTVTTPPEWRTSCVRVRTDRLARFFFRPSADEKAPESRHIYVCMHNGHARDR